MFKGWLGGVGIVLWGSAAVAGSDVDADTRSRHDRAESQASSSPPSRSEPDRSYEPPPTYAGTPVYAVGVGASASTEVWEAPAPVFAVDLAASAFLTFDRLQGTAGGAVVHQEGLGAGFAVDFAVFSADADPADRAGFDFELRLGWARLLDDHQPPGADYSSTMDLLTLEADLGPRWVRRWSGMEFTYGVGLGLTGLFAAERFSDGLELDETLALGFRTRPYIGASFGGPGDLGRPFVHVGLATFLGRITEHRRDYDSLIAGLAPFMTRPYARLGYLFSVRPGLMVGVTYEVNVMARVTSPVSLSHRALLSMRIFDDAMLEGRAPDPRTPEDLEE